MTRPLTPSAVLLTSLAALALAAGCDGVQGSGKLATVTRELSAFTELATRGAFEVAVEFGDRHALVLNGDDNLLPLVTSEVSGGRLVLATNKPVRTRRRLRATVTTKKLNLIKVSGAASLLARKLASASFSLSVSGAARARLAGRAGQLTIDLSGAGDIQARDLRAKAVKVTASGAGSVEVHAEESLEVSISGVGKVTYHGDPRQVKRSISGVGKLIKK